MKAMPRMALVLFSAFATVAVAAPQGQRVRGSVQSVGDNSVTIQSRSGDTVKLKLNDNTQYAWVVKSSLSKVDQDDYVGVASKKVGDTPVALELVIFPQSMRGAGEGHYAWDKLPDTTRSGSGMTSSNMTNGSVGSTMTQSAMTNGTVSGTSRSMSMTQSAMTNGSVRKVNQQARGEQITLKYNGNQKKITIPPSAPIVAFKSASKSALTQGANVFIMAKQNNGQLVAKMVAVGKNGLNPPM